MQWHSTVLARLALVPQRTMNSYSRNTVPEADNAAALFTEGDFVINFQGCEADQSRDCEAEMATFWPMWKHALTRAS